MEIAPVPHRAARGERRWLALGLLVLLPVVLLVLLPAVLGLDRFVVTDRAVDGSVGRGSLVLAREVPAADLEVGDVVTVPSGASEERSTRRIVSIADGVPMTAADSRGAGDQTLPLTGSTHHRVWLGVPWVGYPFLVGGGWLLLALAAGAALVLAAALTLRSRRRLPPVVVEPRRPRLPVG